MTKGKIAHPKPITPKRKMNDIEAEYATMLDNSVMDGEILGWRFEPMAFKLADKTTYTPDFLVVHYDKFQIVEVKARGKLKIVTSAVTGKARKKQWTSKRDDAIVKVKVAASMFPWFEWVYAYHEANGTWATEHVFKESKDIDK